MLRPLKNWLDHRTGYRALISALLIEDIPGGAKWRYVWGSVLTFVFLIQLVTGILLVANYSPGDSTAWASVYYIQYHVDFGWLIRGLHHFGSQAMVILLAVHMLQVVIAGAHLPPREVNWWLGLLLLASVLALSLTGYLLPWDQKGYWATQVATNIAGNVPKIGPWLQKIIVGGPTYGHHTLTRFYTLHVGILPAVVIVLIVAHLAVFRRHGVTTPAHAEGEGWFWPDQAFRDLVMCMVVFAILLGVVLWGHAIPLSPAAPGPVVTAAPTTQPAATLPTASQPAPGPEPMSAYQRLAHLGRRGAGANLDAPADPSMQYPARPEWYFLSLYELLKHVKEIVGTVYVPGGVALALFFVPLLGNGCMRKFGHVMGVLVVSALLASAIVLTIMALVADYRNTGLKAKFTDARIAATRAVQLAALGIPPEGPLQILRRSPEMRGQELFGKHCASCHRYGDIFESGDKASDLAGFGTERWILGLLNNPADPRYFGHTELTRMAEWVEEDLKPMNADPADLRRVAQWLASGPKATSPDAQTEEFTRAHQLFSETFNCIKCHKYEGKGGTSRAPDFTGYGSADWIRGMVMAPDHRTRYGKDNRMTIFLDLGGPDAEIIKEQSAERQPGITDLSAVERELIIRWMLNDNRPVYGGGPIVTPSAPEQ